MGYPAETVDGKIVTIVDKSFSADTGIEVLTDDEGNVYTRSSLAGSALKIVPQDSEATTEAPAAEPEVEETVIGEAEAAAEAEAEAAAEEGDVTLPNPDGGESPSTEELLDETDEDAAA